MSAEKAGRVQHDQPSLEANRFQTVKFVLVRVV